MSQDDEILAVAREGFLDEARDIDQRVASPKKIDEWFEAKTKGLTPVAKATLKQRWGTLQRVLSSKDRLEQIANDIIMDMELKPRLKAGRGNAMLVAGSIPEACRLFEILRNSGSDLAGKCAIVTSYTRNASELTGEEAGMGETEKQYVYRVYDRLMTDLGTDEEAYEAEAKPWGIGYGSALSDYLGDADGLDGGRDTKGMAPPPATNTPRLANSGMYFATGSDKAALPCSTSCMKAIDVIGFVMEAMRKIASVSRALKSINKGRRPRPGRPMCAPSTRLMRLLQSCACIARTVRRYHSRAA